jgi:ribose-phosphate pyrophosphokinase
MVIFPFPQFKQYVRFLRNLPEYKLGGFQVARFPNQELYVKLLTNIAYQDCLILGSITPPDKEAIERNKKIVDELKLKIEIAYMEKQRTSSGVSSVLHGFISPNVIIVDNILDTGGTLLACCKILKSNGAKNIYIFVTHGLFTGNKWQRLFDLNVRKIYCTNSVPQVYSLKSDKLKILSLKSILGDYAHHMQKIQEEVNRAIKKMEQRKKGFLFRGRGRLEC